jgi:hypothetical protein
LRYKNKTHKIKSGEECTISTLRLSTNSAKSGYMVHIGYITNFKDSILTIQQIGQNSICTKGSTQQLNWANTDKQFVSISIKHIEQIEDFRKWFILPASIGWFSLFSAVIVSPLVSLNYNTGAFHTERFSKVSGLGLATTALSFSIAYGFGRHTCFLNTGRKTSKRLWSVQPD